MRLSSRSPEKNIRPPVAWVQWLPKDCFKEEQELSWKTGQRPQSKEDPLQVGLVSCMGGNYHHVSSNGHLTTLQDRSQQLAKENQWVSEKMLEDRYGSARKYFAWHICFTFSWCCGLLWVAQSQNTHTSLSSLMGEKYFLKIQIFLRRKKIFSWSVPDNIISHKKSLRDSLHFYFSLHFIFLSTCHSEYGNKSLQSTKFD